MCDDKPPELMPQNSEVWLLWQKVNTQWRAGGFSIIGLDYPAVIQIAEIYNIDITIALIEKIRALEAFEIERFNKKGGADNG